MSQSQNSQSVLEDASNSGENADRAIILVTGANTGVGYGFCERILLSFCDHISTGDLKPHNSASEEHHFSTDGNVDLTLLMACRNSQKADAAKERLLQYLDQHISKLQGPRHEQALKFKERLEVDVCQLDLASLPSIFELSEKLRTRYPYISHLFFNAGYAKFEVSSSSYMKQLVTNPKSTAVAPEYLVESVGDTTQDGLGLIWQTNLFAHFALYSKLKPLLKSSPQALGGRIIWTTSPTSKRLFEQDDLQLTKTSNPYQSVKYQIELLAAALNEESSKAGENIRHLISSPGIVSSGLGLPSEPVIQTYAKKLIFYAFLRTLSNSPYMTITPEKGALAAVHLSTLSYAGLDHYCPRSGDSEAPVIIESQCNRWGSEKLTLKKMDGWDRTQADALVETCKAQFDIHESKNGAAS